MKKSKQLFYGFFFPIAILGSAWGGGLWWLWVSAAPTNNTTTSSPIRLVIPEGTPMQVIGQELESTGVIRSSLALRLWLQWLAIKEGNTRSLQAGTYDFNLNQPLSEVVSQMQTGKPTEVRFTIPEGWSLEQMAEFFEQKGYFPAKDFIAATGKSAIGRRPWLPKDIASLEGFLFPDTYQIVEKEITPEQVVDLMLNRFEEVALPLYQSHTKTQPKPSLSLAEWVTLSSIVEKESVLDKERKIIASVFLQRLKRNMRLEADPTVEYGLKIKQTKEKPLTIEQVRTPSPYNTYLNPGLPPGAIAAPGLASLEAVLSPEPTEYLFFVARYDGSHIFSRTLAEHNKALNQVDHSIKQQTDKLQTEKTQPEKPKTEKPRSEKPKPRS
ncbi:endolytic transglycosylase MltG [Pseudanabaena sp. PCC 6802]|uniref:endolytic transglycosylase MltG n=1 Tax=Pseudanabaena sp. PCC 6802 TaxID=118173 RepID=UPI00034845FC|nr:endolytic transglycosylase MltG [Pseudanabaena sp. PCC 6802]